jgi:chemotaxis signal transduction protein
VSRYLQIAVGAGLYLIDASRLVDGDGGILPPIVDLRALFEEPAAQQGSPILCTQISGPPALLIADRIDGIVDYDEAEFRKLPPIGPLGEVIDAFVTRLSNERLLLRLRGEHAVAAAAAIG